VERWQWGVAALICGVVGAVLTVWGFLARWTPEVALAVAGLAVSVAGFALALVSIERTRTVARAARDAIDDTLAGLAATRLGVLVVELRQEANSLEEAADAEDLPGARRSINRWRQLGGGAQTLVRRRFGAAHPSIDLLKRSISSGTEAKTGLYGESKTVREATGDSIRHMEKALEELEPLVEDLLPTINQNEESDDGDDV